MGRPYLSRFDLHPVQPQPEHEKKSINLFCTIVLYFFFFFGSVCFCFRIHWQLQGAFFTLHGSTLTKWRRQNMLVHKNWSDLANKSNKYIVAFSTTFTPFCWSACSHFDPEVTTWSAEGLIFFSGTIFLFQYLFQCQHNAPFSVQGLFFTPAFFLQILTALLWLHNKIDV